jgi:hypothetical protein
VTEPAGPLLFARYAYPPNALGLCGADVRRTLLEYGAAGESDNGLAELARTFDGAWPYLELIATANRIDDPLDVRVVEAYWVGNELLDRVDPARLTIHVDERFRGRLGRSREHVYAAARAGAVPHHCFHVFAVYPWLGLLRSGIVDEPLHILDQCRTSVARVLSSGGETATVLARPLVYEDGRLGLGQPVQKETRWSEAGLSFVGRPEPDDLVSLHWDFICDRLTPASAYALESATRRAFRSANVAAPAAVA